MTYELKEHYTHMRRTHGVSLMGKVKIKKNKENETIQKPLINAEDIIDRDDNHDMELYTHFTIEEFNSLYSLVSEKIEKGVNCDSKLTPKTRFLMTLIFCQYN